VDRISPDHPPLCPNRRRPAYVSSQCVAVTLILGKFFPIPQAAEKARNRVVIVGWKVPFGPIQSLSTIYDAQ